MHHFKNLSHYLALFGILIAGFAGLVLFSYDRDFQIGIAVATTLAYIAWGIIHHMLHKDLHIETVIEYIAVALLGFVILYTLVIRV